MTVTANQIMRTHISDSDRDSDNEGLTEVTVTATQIMRDPH